MDKNFEPQIQKIKNAILYIGSFAYIYTKNLKKIIKRIAQKVKKFH